MTTMSTINGKGTKHRMEQQRRHFKQRWMTLSAWWCLIIVIMVISILVVIVYNTYIFTATTTTTAVITATTKQSSTKQYASYKEEQLHVHFVAHDIHHHNDDNDHRDDDNDEIMSADRKQAAPSTCLTEECIQQVASSMARAFPRRTNSSTWCHHGHNNDDDDDDNGGATTKESGLILIKVTKAASSTSAGVALRIARRNHCNAVQWKHRFAHEIHYQPNRTFLFSIVREPAARAVSTTFFHILSRQKADLIITDAMVLQQLQTRTHHHYGATSAGQGGFQLRYLYPPGPLDEYSAWNPDRPEQVVNATRVREHVRETMDAYDFIMVPERMDESLVALALLLQIDVADVLVTSSKVAGTSQYHLLHPNRSTFHCLATRPSHVSPVVARFLQSKHWRAMNYGDYVLYEAVRQSLDRTIRETIGMVPFQTALQRYRTLKQLEQTYCAPHVQFPCSNGGVPQLEVAKENCYLYYYDFGCGYPCIDDIVGQYDNGTLSIQS